jgi:glucosamine 6-phosphate synthetase-like amidotransferase/phosphosugar isomerase protein
MCSICGIAFQKDNNIYDSMMVRKILSNLLVNCQARGSQATGVAFASDKNIVVVKNNVSAKKFVETREFRRACMRYLYLPEFSRENMPVEESLPIQVIGHCRAPTKGTPLNNANNHPIVTSSLVGVHNGSISNDDALFKEFDREIERDAEVDSEVIFKLIEGLVKESNDPTAAIQATAEAMRGSFACAMILASNPYLLYIFRNNQMPVSIMHYPKIGMIIFASMKRFIEEAVKGAPLGESFEIEMDYDSGICFNLYNGSAHRFSLMEQSQPQTCMMR